MPLNGLIWQVLQAAATEAGIDPFLAGAVAMEESSWNPSATPRFEPKWDRFVLPLAWAVRAGVPEEEERRAQATSWGIMQVMGAVLRELGYQRRIPDLTLSDGAKYGTLKLAALLGKYPLTDAIASYNAGSPRRNPDGTYVNQAYVDNVLKYVDQIKGSVA